MLVLGLNASMKYKVFVHNEGEELWIAGTGYSPIQLIIFTLGKLPALCGFQVAPIWMSNNFDKYQFLGQKQHFLFRVICKLLFKSTAVSTPAKPAQLIM